MLSQNRKLAAAQQLRRIPCVYDGPAAGAAYGAGGAAMSGRRLRVQLDRITVETDLFEHREVKPHFINPCCFGEDFAAWLKRELSRFPDLLLEVSEPIQEDYGWGFWATRGKDRFWVALSYVGDGPQEAPVQWVVSVTYDPGLNLAKRFFHKPDQQAIGQLRDRIRQILTSNSAIKTVTP